MEHKASAITRNRMLAALPEQERSVILANVDVVMLKSREVIHEQLDEGPDVYFPLTAVISLLNVMEDGDSVEVATIGNEGVIGMHLLFHGQPSQARAVTQAPGHAARMGRETFRGLTECRTLHHLVDRYMKTLLSQLFLSSGCNRFHSATERCARWLLMMHDRYETGEFPFTQDFLSEMLGVRRQSVAVMEATLERAGLIQTRRGCVAILDRAGLETVACECYKRVKAEFDLYLNGGKAPAVTGHECAPSPIH